MEINQMTKSHVERGYAAAFEQPPTSVNPLDSRTLRNRWLLDTVLPGLALLSMSVLTVTMIVLVVTTVAHGGWLMPGTYVSVDPWVAVSPGLTNLRHNDLLYPNDAMDPLRRDPMFASQIRSADAGHFAAESAE